MSELTKTQAAALQWIDTFPCHESSWHNKCSYIRLTRERGSIKISADDWNATMNFHEPNGPTYNPIWRLTDAGRAALAKSRETE